MPSMFFMGTHEVVKRNQKKSYGVWSKLVHKQLDSGNPEVRGKRELLRRATRTARLWRYSYDKVYNNNNIGRGER
jgi:hypothetical protein